MKLDENAGGSIRGEQSGLSFGGPKRNVCGGKIEECLKHDHIDRFPCPDCNAPHVSPGERADIQILRGKLRICVNHAARLLRTDKSCTDAGENASVVLAALDYFYQRSETLTSENEILRAHDCLAVDSERDQQLADARSRADTWRDLALSYGRELEKL
jgi:hypothetical protein